MDSEQLVVAMNVDDNVDIFLGTSRQAAPIRRLTDSAITDFAPVLSPDRSSVVYVQQFANTSTGAESGHCG